MLNSQLKRRIQKIFEYVTSKLPCLVCNTKMITLFRTPLCMRPRGAKFFNPTLNVPYDDDK